MEHTFPFPHATHRRPQDGDDCGDTYGDSERGTTTVCQKKVGKGSHGARQVSTMDASARPQGDTS